MGVARETALALSNIFVFQMENTNIHEVKLKMSCYNRDYMHSGLCEQYVSHACKQYILHAPLMHCDIKPLQNRT